VTLYLSEISFIKIKKDGVDYGKFISNEHKVYATKP
jgi:hypothetical protein